MSETNAAISSGLVFNIQKFSLHDGAGIRTNVFFQGCNLRCEWCANPESQEINPSEGAPGLKRYTVDELAAELVKDKPFYDMSGGGVTLTGGEAMLQPEFVLELCGVLRESGINVVIETSASVCKRTFSNIVQACGAVYADLKHYDEEAHRRGTGIGNSLILSNIRAALESGVRTIIRIPVIPGYNCSFEDMGEFALLLGQLGAKEVHLLPFHQMGESKYEKLGIEYRYAGVRQLHDEDLEPFAKILVKSGAQVQIGG